MAKEKGLRSATGALAGRSLVWRTLAAACLLVTLAIVPSCVDDGDGLPDIVSMSVEPSTIPQSDTGMVDETIDVTIVVADFTSEIVEADTFVQLPSGGIREASKEEMNVNGNTLELVGITKSLFSGLSPGDYQMGAVVTSATGEVVEESDLATVSITP